MFKGKFVKPGTAALMVVLGLLLFTAVSCGSNGNALTIKKLKDSGNSMYGQEIRLTGRIVAGSIDLNNVTGVMRFTLNDGTATLDSVYQGLRPDMLASDVDLILIGKYDAPGIFNSSAVDQEKTVYCKKCHE